MSTRTFGRHPRTGEEFILTTVKSKPRGIIEVSFMNLGATIVSWKLGQFTDKKELVLGFEDGASYLSPDNPYFGATIGRIANRIAKARLNDVNGQDYQLSPNDGVNVVHSGPEGLHHRVFEGPIVLDEGDEGDRLTVAYFVDLKHMDDNFPGTIQIMVKYSLGEEIKPSGVIAGRIGIQYDARIIGEAKETAIAMTNHRYPSVESVNPSYFNIGDGPTIDGTRVQLATATKQDVDEEKIPTGTTSPHPAVHLFTEATPRSFTLGQNGPVFDNCFILPEIPEPRIDTRDLPLKDMAHLFNEQSKVNLLASTTEPTFQLYTGDGVDVADGNKHFGYRSGLCLEAGRPINAVNDPTQRKWVILKEGEVYGSYTEYTAWVSK